MEIYAFNTVPPYSCQLVNPEVYSREAIQSSNRLAEEDINGGIEWFCSVWAKTYYKCT
jgi:hypothetical protein